MSGTGTILTIGAGPKAVAVAAKAAALRELGQPAPRVIAVEPRAVGANWLPLGGWTDGNHRLGTSPEKDIGFPYRSHLVPGHSRALNARMHTHSWQSFLVETGGFAEWVDRGKPSPEHRTWARYLQWVADRVQMEIVPAAVVRASVDGAEWSLMVRDSADRERELRGDALLVTGPGGAGTSPLPDNPRVLGVAEFWALAGSRSLPASSLAAVIGGGETAGSVLDELARHQAMSISVISPRATLYTRGESYFENAMFSDPDKWSSLTEEERRDVIRRTDRGVFSVRVQESLLCDNRIAHLPGRVSRIRALGDAVGVTVRAGARKDVEHRFDLVVDATGGDPLWFLDLFDQKAKDVLELAVGWPVTPGRIENSIGYDLAVEGMGPKLFLPNLAAMTQGPGFPNLSCLGLLSDRVVGARIGAADLAGAR